MIGYVFFELVDVVFVIFLWICFRILFERRYELYVVFVWVGFLFFLIRYVKVCLGFRNLREMVVESIFNGMMSFEMMLLMGCSLLKKLKIFIRVNYWFIEFDGVKFLLNLLRIWKIMDRVWVIFVNSDWRNFNFISLLLRRVLFVRFLSLDLIMVIWLLIVWMKLERSVFSFFLVGCWSFRW